MLARTKNRCRGARDIPELLRMRHISSAIALMCQFVFFVSGVDDTAREHRVEGEMHEIFRFRIREAEAFRQGLNSADLTLSHWVLREYPLFGLPETSQLDEVRMLVDFVYRHVPWTDPSEADLYRNGVEAYERLVDSDPTTRVVHDLASLLKYYEDANGGVLCGGSSYILTYVLNYFGYWGLSIESHGHHMPHLSNIARVCASEEAQVCTWLILDASVGSIAVNKATGRPVDFFRLLQLLKISSAAPPEYHLATAWSTLRDGHQRSKPFSLFKLPSSGKVSFGNLYNHWIVSPILEDLTVEVVSSIVGDVVKVSSPRYPWRFAALLAADSASDDGVQREMWYFTLIKQRAYSPSVFSGPLQDPVDGCRKACLENGISDCNSCLYLLEGMIAGSVPSTQYASRFSAAKSSGGATTATAASVIRGSRAFMDSQMGRLLFGIVALSVVGSVAVVLASWTVFRGIVQARRRNKKAQSVAGP